MNVVQKAWHGLKALTVRFGSGPWWGGFWAAGTGEYSYERSIPDDGRSNSIVAACVKWLARTFPEAPLVVRERVGRGKQGEWEDRPDHRLQELLDRPNPFYSGLHLWSATVADWMFGDAYWVKVRSGDGRVAQLWWMPSWMMAPKWDDGAFISYYEQTVDGQVIRWRLEDVVHFRNGNDPKNPRQGLGLKSLIREVATDQEAAGWTVAMVRNVNPPGVVISPDASVVLDAANAERVKQTFSARFSGERRGEPLVMSSATKVDVLSFSPEQMNLKDIRRVPEERITAYLGIPAVVVGLGAGLDRSTFANFAEAREAAYESCLIPTQRLFAADLNAQLVPEFGDPKRLRLEFDLSQVRVLQDDQNALHERARADLLAGLLSLNEARQMLGLEPVDGDAGDMHFVPGTVTPRSLEDIAAPPEPVALPAPAEDDEDVPADDEEGDDEPRRLRAAGVFLPTNGHATDIVLASAP